MSDLPPESPSLVPAGTVLLVEDDQLARQATARSLQHLGYAVIEASSAEDALALLGGDPVPSIDLLLTDVVLPGADGYALAREVRAIIAGVSVLVISGYPDEPGHAEPAWGECFLPKPYSRSELANAVRQALAAGNDGGAG